MENRRQPVTPGQSERDAASHRNFRPTSEAPVTAAAAAPPTETPQIDSAEDVRQKIRAGIKKAGEKRGPVVHHLDDFVPVKNAAMGETVYTEPTLAREQTVSDLQPGELLVGPKYQTGPGR